MRGNDSNEGWANAAKALDAFGALAMRTQELIEETRSTRTALLVKELIGEIQEVRAALSK